MRPPNKALKLTASANWSAAADMERPLSTTVTRFVVRSVVVVGLIA